MKNLLIIILITFFSLIFSNDIFVINSGSETLSKINLETQTVDNVFAVLGEMPNKMAFYDNKIYVVNSGDNSVQIIDDESGETLGNIFIENSSNPYDIIIFQDFAYVTGLLMNKIYKIDLLENILIDSFFIGNNPSGLSIIDNYLYVSNTDYALEYANCSISQISLSDFVEVNRFDCGINPQYITAIDNKLHISCNGNWDNIYGKVQVWNPITEEFEVELDFGNIFLSNIAVLENDILVGDANGDVLLRYSRADFSILNSANNSLPDGAQLITSDGSNIYTLSGLWGQNFEVKKRNSLFEEENAFIVGLYGTDIKFLSSDVNTNEDVNCLFESNLSNFPNPFNPSTTIQFSVQKDNSKVKLSIFNIKGQKVKTLINEIKNKGDYSVNWKAENQNSGVYFFRLKINDLSITSRGVLLK